MLLFQNNAGFNITKSKLQLVEVNYTENDFYLENVDEEYFSDFIDSSIKETKFISILQSAFNSLVLRNPLKSNFVSFSLPYEFFKIVTIPFDNTLIESDLKEYVEWEFSLLFPQCYQNEYTLRYVKIDNSDLLGKNKIIIYAVEKRILKLLHKFAIKNNITIKFVDNVHLSANSIILSDSEFSKLQNSVSIYLTDDSVNLMLLEGANPVYLQSFSYSNINDLVTAFSNGFNALQKVNVDSGLFHKAYIFTDSVSDAIIEQVKTKLNVNLLRLNPFEQILQNPTIKENEITQKKLLMFSSALGTVLRIE